MNETINVLTSHRSIRKFTDQPISDEVLETLVRSGQAAASSSFIQAYSIIDIVDAQLRDKLATCAADQNYVRSAARFLVFCGDNRRLAQCAEQQSVDAQFGFTEQLITAAIDAALVAQNMVVAAESLGIGTCYIGAIRNQPDTVSELLELPELVIPLFGLCLGYPDQDPGLKPRLPAAAVLHKDGYQPQRYFEMREDYQRTTQEYYTERTAGKETRGWEEQMANKLQGESRPHLRAFLNKQGFATR